ncbi:MAG: protein kinase [Ignavibacteriales bacterium]|nr:protein kinase [Ignavibacteriales bacterium]
MIGQTVSHYKILEKLGEGGMGVVYKAQDLQLDRLVALKFLSSHLSGSEQDKARFVQEAKAAAALNHSNICTIYGIEEHHEQMFIAMEWVEGRTLKEKIGESPLLSEEIVSVALQVGEGLLHAHENGIIHRDIKPENIMLLRHGGAKIMDFGLAQIAGRSRVVSEGAVVGTIAYMSPEQVRGEKLDARSDIWSLGASLYEATAGRVPFPGQYEQAAMYLILNESPTPLATLVPEVPIKLQSIIEKALQKEPERRYQSVREMLEELRSFKEELTRARTHGVIHRARTAVPGAEAVTGIAERERRLVTIVLAGIMHVDQLYERRDSEFVTTILSDCFKGLTSVLLKYGGTVEKMAAEHGLMATFGAPVAHEDDPDRALRCALELMSFIGRFNSLMSARMPVPLALRIGIHSGTVVAGGDLETGYAVMGDTVNVAAGVLDVAAEGQICLSGETYRLVDRIAETELSRSVRLRGTTHTVDVSVLRGLKSEAATKRGGIGKGEFIGRAQEIDTLKKSLDLVVSRKEVRLFICGEPGVGKTRLSEELLTLARAKGMSTYEGKCSSFEVNTPYFLWNTLLKSVLRLGPDATERETRVRLHDLLQILSLEAEEPYLATLLSLRYEEILLEVDEQRKRRIFQATQKLLKALAHQQPNLFVFEDLHWIDRFSQALLQFVFTDESVAPALFFFAFRPDYVDKKTLTFGETIDLDRLSDAEAASLIKSHFEVDEVPDALEQLLHKRAEGNPFFVEETVRTLLDRKMIAIRKRKMEVLIDNVEAGVPETIQGVIMARIDRLEHRIRDVLLDASVIGREFSRPVLEHVVARKNEVVPSLQELQTLEFILEKQEAQELEYLFKHYLIQEVAYNTILTEKRKKLHGLIARAVEQLYSERLKEFYELLAFHYEKAEEWDKAAEYLSRAGRKVSEIYSREESSGFVKRKEEALEKLYESHGERRIGWIILSLVTAAIATPLAGVMIAIPYYLGYMYWNLPPYIQFSLFGSELLGDIAFLLYLLILTFGYPMGALIFVFFGVIPAFRGSPKLYDLWEDQIRVVFGSGRIVSIGFSDIHNLNFLDKASRAERSLASKILDPFFLISDYSQFSVVLWFKKVIVPRKFPMAVGLLAGVVGFFVLYYSHMIQFSPSILREVSDHPGWFYLLVWLGVLAGFYFPRDFFRLPPYSFGFSSRRGEVRIERSTGWNRLRIVFPWFHSPSKSRFISLTPSDPREFFEQLEIAFAKWKRQKVSSQAWNPDKGGPS